MNVSNARVNCIEGVKQLKGEKVKGKVNGVGTYIKVKVSIVPEVQKKQVYIQHAVAYWNSKKGNLIMLNK